MSLLTAPSTWPRPSLAFYLRFRFQKCWTLQSQRTPRRAKLVRSQLRPIPPFLSATMKGAAVPPLSLSPPPKATSRKGKSVRAVTVLIPSLIVAKINSAKNISHPIPLSSTYLSPLSPSNPLINPPPLLPAQLRVSSPLLLLPLFDGGDGDALGRRRSRGGRRLGGADFVVVDFAVVLVEEGFEVGLWERRGREAGE